MAEETKRIIEIEAKYQTLAEMQAAVDAARMSVQKMEKEGKQWTDEYQKGLVEMKSAQNAYNAEMRITVKENTAAEGSYNDLVNQLARLKEQWKQAKPDTAAYVELTKKVNDVKGRLEAMDHSIGNWQRNVGNYANSIRSVAGLFGQAGGAVTGAIGAVQGLTQGFKALSATPVIGTITIIVSLLAKVIGSLKQSESASMRLAEAMAPLKAGGDLLKRAFEGLANGLATVAEWLGKVADKLGLYSEKMKENQAIVRESNALKQRERDMLVENARLEKEASEARLIAADKANRSAAERVKALEKAEAAERQILANEKDMAQKRLDLMKRQAALSPNDTATNDALAQAEANMFRVETSFNDGMRRIESQHSAALLEMRRETGGALIEEAQEVTDALMEIDEKAFERMDAGIKARMEAQKMRRDFERDEMAAMQQEEDALFAEIQNTIANQQKAEDDAVAENKKKLQQRLNNTVAVANGIASVMDSIAGAYQNDIKAQVESGKISEEEGEKRFEAVKALQIGVSTIQMLTGITTALSGAFTTKTGPWDIALAAVQAASIAASGIANISKISNATLGNTSTASAVGSGVQSVQTVAPAVQVAVPEYRTLTSASDEQAINQRQANQKVVLVTSELEAHTEGHRVKLQEATF